MYCLKFYEGIAQYFDISKNKKIIKKWQSPCMSMQRLPRPRWSEKGHMKNCVKASSDYGISTATIRKVEYLSGCAVLRTTSCMINKSDYHATISIIPSTLGPTKHFFVHFLYYSHYVVSHYSMSFSHFPQSLVAFHPQYIAIWPFCMMIPTRVHSFG